jgi:hypothetical protein
MAAAIVLVLGVFVFSAFNGNDALSILVFLFNDKKHKAAKYFQN